MGKIRFLWDNKFDGGTLTYSTQAANFPAANVQHRWWGKAWRSTVCTNPQYLIKNMAATPPISVCAIRYCNFAKSGAAVIQIWAGNNADADDHVIDTFGVNNNDLMVESFPAVATEQYWRLNINDPTNPDLYQMVGRLFMGGYFSPAHNFQPGGGFVGYDDLSRISDGEDGHSSGIIQENLRIFHYEFPWMSAADAAIIRSMYDLYRCLGGFFFTEDSDNPTTTTYYVRFKEPPQFSPQMAGWSSVTITLVEAM